MAPLSSLSLSPEPSPTERRTHRPPPLRTQSQCEGTISSPHESGERPTSRRNSTFSPWYPNPLTPKSPTRRRGRASSRASPPQRCDFDPMYPVPENHGHTLPTPPITPSAAKGRARGDSDRSLPDVITYDFTKMDYELDRARVLGTGLWSKVLLGDAAPPVLALSSDRLTPPNTPPRRPGPPPPSLYAVKIPLRRDAHQVFRQEARVVTHLTRQEGASDHIIAFHGYDTRNSSLVFEAVIGGSLENLNTRLKQMTEVARHLELISIFPGIAYDLVSGLDFMHSHGVIHADLKPANVLLDIYEDRADNATTSTTTTITSGETPRRPVLRARYIDFSASFRPGCPEDSTKHSGGTWDYMAPEQMRSQKEFNVPTCASDVWSLGITLLSLIVGRSPYTAAVGDGNVFMLREAIKSADPIGFARVDAKVSKRIAACQDFVDCVRLVLIKDRERRATAKAWKRWIEMREL